MKLKLGMSLLTVVGIVSGIYYFSYHSAMDNPALAQAVVEVPKPSAAHVTIPSGRPSSASTSYEATNHWSATSLASTLKRSSSYQLFIQEALRNPEKGGVLYAQNVVFGCTKTNDALLGTSKTNDAKRVAILADFHARCNITLEQYNALLRAQPGIRERDPLFSMVNALTSNKPDIKKKALAEALKSQDPMLLFETSALTFLRRVPPSAEGGGEKVLTYFNGQWLTEAEAAPFRYAQKLVACDFGLPCQQNDVWLNNLCVTANECANSRQEYMERFVYPNQPQWQTKIEQYRAAIKQAVQSQSVATFVPQN